MKARGGGKQRGRKPKRTEQDDRPRGYEAHRMRQLWRDIDESKHKAGLGTSPEPPPAASCDLTGVVERASALAGDALAWMSSALPAACALVESGAALLRDVPLLGRIATLWSTAAPTADAAPAAARGVEAHRLGPVHNGTHSNGGSDEPNGEWIH